METHHDSQPDASAHHGVPTASLTTAALRFAASTIRAAGYPATAQLITEWPELLGTKLGKIILRLGNQQKITTEDENIFEAALKDAPAETAQVVGIMMTASLVPTLGAKAETTKILDCYATVLNIVWSAMQQRSFALRGFIHRSDCISYWHYGYSDELGFRRHLDLITPSSAISVYLVPQFPSEDILEQLNLDISGSDAKRLTREFYEQPDVEIVKEIYVQRVVTSIQTPVLPLSKTYKIPPGAADLIGLVESLRKAVATQNVFWSVTKATMASIQNVLNPALS
ncbi:MAG: hypothetical protein ABSD98_12755 [Candidatus Korobacteraceae bacterium]|jgi:hypothetical protein